MDILFFARQGIQIYALYLILVAIHEAGHHFAAALAGYRWKGWIVGPLCISRETGRVRVSYSKQWFTGQASAFPHLNDTQLRQAVSIIGGPFFTLLFGIVLFVYLRGLPSDEENVPWQVVTMLWLSFFMLLGSVIPYKPPYYNDAMLLLELWHDKEKWLAYQSAQDRYWALKKLAAAQRDGQRPRDWDEAVLRTALTLQDGNANEALAAYYGFYWAADKDDWEQAGNYSDRALALHETLPPSHRPAIVLNAAFYAGFIRRDGQKARELMAEALSAEIPDAETKELISVMTLRAEAAALLAECHPAAARAKAQEALSLSALAKHSCFGGRYLLEKLLASCVDANEES